MAINDTHPTLKLSGLVLAVLLQAPGAALARTEASATPVPFPEPPALPADAELQSTVAQLDALLAHIGRYIGDVYAATENYREYVQVVKEMLAGCEVELDVSEFEGTGFEGFAAAGGEQCRAWVAGFDQRAMAYAAKLDESLAYQKLLEKVGQVAQRQRDRARLSLHANQLKRAVDKGLGEVKKSRESIKPWMDSKGKSR